MTIIEKSVEINAPPEEVWRLLTDLDRFHEWAKTVEMELASERQGLGATYHTTAKFLGMDFEISQKCTEWIENRKWTYRMSFGGKEGRISFILEPAGLGTKLTEDIDYELPYSYLGKIFDKLKVKAKIEKLAEDELKNLKNILEE